MAKCQAKLDFRVRFKFWIAEVGKFGNYGGSFFWERGQNRQKGQKWQFRKNEINAGLTPFYKQKWGYFCHFFQIISHRGLRNQFIERR